MVTRLWAFGLGVISFTIVFAGNHDPSTLVSRRAEAPPLEVKLIDGRYYAFTAASEGLATIYDLRQVYRNNRWEPVTAADVPKPQAVLIGDKYHSFQFSLKDGVIRGTNYAVYDDILKEWESLSEVQKEAALDENSRKLIAQGKALRAKSRAARASFDHQKAAALREKDEKVPVGKASPAFPRTVAAYQGRLGHLANGGVDATRVRTPDELMAGAGLVKRTAARGQHLRMDAKKHCAEESTSAPTIVIVAKDEKATQKLSEDIERFKAFLAARKMAQIGQNLKGTAITGALTSTELFLRGFKGLFEEAPSILKGEGYRFTESTERLRKQNSVGELAASTATASELGSIGLDFIVDATAEVRGPGYEQYREEMGNLFTNLIAGGIAEKQGTRKMEKAEAILGRRSRTGRIFNRKFGQGISEGEGRLRHELLARSQEMTKMASATVKAGMEDAEGQFLTRAGRNGLAGRSCLGFVWDETSSKWNERLIGMSGKDGAGAAVRIPTNDPARPEIYMTLMGKDPRYAALLLDRLIHRRYREGKLTDEGIAQTIESSKKEFEESRKK